MQVKQIITVAICIFFLFGDPIFAQLFPRDRTGDSSASNTINLRSDKFLNTFIFSSNANLKYDIYGGDLIVNQTFYGKSIKSIKNSITDDEKLGLSYSHPINKHLSLLAYQNWIYSSEPLSTDLNLSERINGGIGASFKLFDNAYINASAGLGKNNQVGEIGFGPLFRLNSRIEGYNIDDYNIDFGLSGEYEGLKNSNLTSKSDRVNSNYDLKTSIYKIFDKDNLIRFNAQYRNFSSDMIATFYKDTNTGFVPIERRNETMMQLGIDLNYSLTKYLLGGFRMSLEKLDIDKNFRSETKRTDRSAFNVNPNELKMAFSADQNLVLSSFRQSVGIVFYYQQVKNLVEKKYDVSEKDFLDWKKLEFQKDFNSSSTQLYTKTDWMPSTNDTFRVNYSVSLSQYDTPSKDMNDDKDVFNSIVNIAYIHKFSNEFVAYLNADVQMLHLVYLQSQMSSYNNWNRVYRFSPAFIWATDLFTIKPQFEILSNYTTYDFEDRIAGDQSQSHRQVLYKDSIYVKLGRNLSLQNNISIRYFEDGTLYWNTFSEAINSRTREYYFKSLLITDYIDGMIIGGGIRYFGLYQNDVSAFAKSVKQFSYSPETFFKINLRSGSSIIFQGWYEIQKNERNEKRYIPNFFLTTNIQL